MRRSSGPRHGSSLRGPAWCRAWVSDSLPVPLSTWEVQDGVRVGEAGGLEAHSRMAGLAPSRLFRLWRAMKPRRPLLLSLRVRSRRRAAGANAASAPRGLAVHQDRAGVDNQLASVDAADAPFLVVAGFQGLGEPQVFRHAGPVSGGGINQDL